MGISDFIEPVWSLVLVLIGICVITLLLAVLGVLIETAIDCVRSRSLKPLSVDSEKTTSEEGSDV